MIDIKSRNPAAKISTWLALTADSRVAGRTSLGALMSSVDCRFDPYSIQNGKAPAITPRISAIILNGRGPGMIRASSSRITMSSSPPKRMKCGHRDQHMRLLRLREAVGQPLGVSPA